MVDHPDVRVAAPGVAVTLTRSTTATRLTVEYGARAAPTLTCDLAGLVPAASVGARGRTLTFGLRPFPRAGVPGHGTLELVVVLELDATAGGLTLSIDGPLGYPFERLIAPGRFRLPGRSGAPWQFVVPAAEGLAVPAEPAAWTEATGSLPRDVDLFGEWISLPLVALTRGPDAHGGSLIVLSPQGDDHTVRMLADDGGRGPGFELLQCAALGTLAYRRVWRLRWVADVGLVALAAAIRNELEAAGADLRTLPRKLADRGMSDASIDAVGGTHLWWHVDRIPAELPGQLRREGLRSVVVMGRLDPEVQRETEAAGLIAGTYFMSSDLYPPGSVRTGEWRGLFPPEGATDGWPDQLARTREGWLQPNWVHTPAPRPIELWGAEPYLTEQGRPGWRQPAVADFHPTQGYYRCPHFHVPTVRRWGRLGDHVAGSAVFCDVTTAAGAIECHAAAHPCDRRGDIAARREQLALLGAGGRFVSSECGKWWALGTTDAFEGMLKYERDLNNRVLGDYPFRPEWWQTQFNLELRVPLFGLVARSAVVRTMWWGHGHDRHEQTWDAKDALCALFGANPIFVADPAHPLRPGTPRWARFVDTARAFDLLRRLTFGQGIASYEVRGRHVGVSRFDGGTEVRANVGPVDADGLPAGGFEILDPGGTRVWPPAGGMRPSRSR